MSDLNEDDTMAPTEAEMRMAEEDATADASRCAAALGRRGKGDAKRRGDSAYYRGLVGRRKDRSPK
jgi:hypothetical protein